MRVLSTLFTALFCCVISPAVGFGQVAHSGPWTGYYDGNGILGFDVQDSFICISTYNGQAFVNTNTHQTQFFCDFNNPDLPLSYNSNIIYDHFIDKSGQFWAINNGNLIRIQQNGTVEVMGPAPQYQVSVLTMDRNGQIWAGLLTQTLNNPEVSTCLAKFNGTGWNYIDVGVTQLNVQAIEFDELNRPVLATASAFSPAGLYYFDGNAFVHINGLINAQLAVSSDGQYATAGNGYNGSLLRVYKNGVWTVYGQSGVNDQKEFAYPVFDAQNNLWTVNERAKVFRINSNGIVQTLTPPVNFQSDPDVDIVTGMDIDDKGQLWLATSAGLFCAPDPNVDVWEYVQTAPMLLPHNGISFGYSDTILLRTKNDMTQIVQENPEKITWPGSIPDGFLYDSYRKGLWSYKGSAMTFYGATDTLTFDLWPIFPEPFYIKINDLKQDAAGNLWIINTRTVIKYTTDGQWEQFDSGEELAPYDVDRTALNGTDMWVITRGKHIDPTLNVYGGELVKISGNTITKANFDYSFLKNVLSFAVFSDSNMWFSIYNGYDTILHFQNGLVTTYTKQDFSDSGFPPYFETVKYNDSTLLLFSAEGLYFYKNDQWYFPPAAPFRYGNSFASIWQISNNGKLYIKSHPLFVFDTEQYLAGLSTNHPIDPVVLADLVYPNPTNGLLNIEQWTQQCPDCQLMIYSEEGRLLSQYPVPLPSKINLEHFPDGVYILSLQAPGEKGKSIEVVKSH